MLRCSRATAGGCGSRSALAPRGRARRGRPRRGSRGRTARRCHPRRARSRRAARPARDRRCVAASRRNRARVAAAAPATSASRSSRRDSELAVHFDTKIAIILDQQLAVWQKANVTAFLISGIAATDPALVGEPYIDGTGNRYLPMCRQPIVIYAADRPGLRRAYERAMAREIERLAIFTHDLFSTPHDQAKPRRRRRSPRRRARPRRHRPPRRPKNRRQSPGQAPPPSLATTPTRERTRAHQVTLSRALPSNRKKSRMEAASAPIERTMYSSKPSPSTRRAASRRCRSGFMEGPVVT